MSAVKINPNRTINASQMSQILGQCKIENGILKIPKSLLEGWNGMENIVSNLFQNSEQAPREVLLEFGKKNGINQAQID